MQAAPFRAFKALLEDLQDEYPGTGVTCDDLPDHLVEAVEEALQRAYNKLEKLVEQEGVA